MNKFHIILSFVGLLSLTMPVQAQNEIAGYSMNSSTAASTATTQYGKVCGYIENGVYTYKNIPYASASRFEELHASRLCQEIRSPRQDDPTCLQKFRAGWYMVARTGNPNGRGLPE